jgi:hypothetical protein
MTTKDQERQAIEEIRKIVEGLGENSYVGFAMEGVLELAEENIREDTAYSMKRRAEIAEEQTDGYLIRKVQEDGTQRERFEFVHRAVWEEHHGEIPKGKMVSFLDGDKDNCNIENLFLIDNETNLEMNRRELRFDEAELTKVGRNIAKLNISARNRKKGKR